MIIKVDCKLLSRQIEMLDMYSSVMADKHKKELVDGVAEFLSAICHAVENDQEVDFVRTENHDWYETDPDCYQHMRNNGNTYEMIQAVWLDTTEEDRTRGLHEYCICQGEIDLDDFSEKEMESYISAYGYTMEILRREYEEDMWGVIAECILEEYIMHDSCVVADADSFEEAKKIIENIIGGE